MNSKIYETKQKLRGGYYTPLDLAKYIADWVVATEYEGPLLEPSCGDGVFVEALAQTKRKVNIQVHELIPSEAESTEKKKTSNLNLKVFIGDFLEWACENYLNALNSFAGALGNPPFIRYQYMEKTTQYYSEQIFKRNDLTFTKHTNCWVPFLVASVAFLVPGGRCGMIVPTEILHVTYAQELRRYLSKTCKKIFVIDPKDIWFDGTLQGACILLLEKKCASTEKSAGISIMSVSSKEFLGMPAQALMNKAKYVNGTIADGKWTKILLTDRERDIFEHLSQHSSVHKFKDIADVDVGIVTGANDFFLVPNATVSKYDLKQWSHPMLGRSEHCPGIIYNKKQHVINQTKGLPTNFLWFDVDDDSTFSDSVKQYIQFGVDSGLTARYKCRIRNPWYKIPSVYSTEIGMLKRSHNFPKLIYNPLKAFTTDTVYRIRLKNKLSPQAFVSLFINSATALSAELEGRYYGGGVLELTPSEVERLLIIDNKTIQLNIKELDNDIKSLPAIEVLRKQDSIILGALGFSKTEQEVLNAAWERLSKRRQRNEP